LKRCKVKGKLSRAALSDLKGRIGTVSKSSTAAVSSPAIIADQDICALLGVSLHPGSAKIIGDLLSKFDAIAGGFYKRMINRQLPPNTRDKLTETGRAIWYGTYKVLCEVNFVNKCLHEYHSKHRPGFIRSLPDIKVLSSSSVGDVEKLTGDTLLNFLLGLDSAIRKMAEHVFNSNWREVVDRISSALEGESLDAVSYKDFTNVLDIAGIPSIASSSIWNLKTRYHGTHASDKGTDKPTVSGDGSFSSSIAEGVYASSRSLSVIFSMEPYLMSYLKTRYSGTNTSGEYVDKSATSGDGSSSGSIVKGKQASSSSVSIPVSTHAEAGIVCSTVGVPTIQYVDLLGVKLHLGSAELICRIFHGFCKSARMSYSRSIYNYLSTAVNGELSTIGRAIWCRIYRELHLSSFMSRCLCIYHYKYRPDVIRALTNIRVLSSTFDCELVPLSGGVLLDFLSKLDCAAFNVAESVFKSQWDVVTGEFFAELEGGSLCDVSCEDVISVLNIAGIPVVAFLDPKRQPKTGKSKVSGNGSGKVASGVTTLVSATTDFMCSSSSLQLQSELLYQPEPDSLPEGTGSSSSSLTETVPQGCVISESKTSEGSSGKCADGTESVSSTAVLTHSPVISSAKLRSALSSSQPESLPNPCPQSETQLRSLLLFDEKHDQSSRRFVKLLSYRDQPANLSDIVAVSTSDEPPSNYSDLGALAGELSPVPSSPPSTLFAPLSPSASELEPDSRPEPQYQYEMQLVPLSGECFSSISVHGSVSTLEGDASDLRVLEDGSSSSESESSSSSESESSSSSESESSSSSSSESVYAPELYEDAHSAFVTRLVMEYLEASTSDSVVAGPSSSSPVSADMRGGRGGSSSSLQGGVQRRGRKRKRNE
ncbi:hypothetical protein, partial [Candidatus Ichthyocystis sparus]